ncbi:MAG: peptidoglycan-binding domain-containing protein [Pyrinomonadaceae bacterium]
MIIKRGDFGNGVAIVQFALTNITSFVPKLKTDGVFGVNTEGRVRQHQSQKKLQADGIVGPITLDSLFDIVQLTATTKFRQNDVGRGTSSGFQLAQAFKPQTLSFPGGSLIPPFRPPAAQPPILPDLQSPGIAEFLRHQKAFWTWFAQPVPKPPRRK